MNKKFFYWLPRILAIFAILFMMIFSLDCFDEAAVRDILVCFVMHNIPAFIIISALIVAWKWELIGGILFILVFIAGCVFFKVFQGNTGALIVMAPFLVTGILFLVYHYLYLREN